MARRANKPHRRISDAELELLKILWSEGPSTPKVIHESLADAGTSRAYTTVQTLLHRLLEKGYVERERDGVAQIYSAVDREDVLAEHMDDLAARVCEGAATPLLMSLVRSKRISRADVKRMRALLDEELKRGRGRR